MTESSGESDPLIPRIRAGDQQGLAEFFSRHRQRLWQIVHFRLDPRLRGRVDADDVLQEAYLDAARRLHHFPGDTTTSLFIWLRMIVTQTMVDLHRRHLGARMRDAGREVSLGREAPPGATSTSIAFELAGDLTSPSQAAVRAELSGQLEEALEGMDPIDREVLALRHFEELSNAEVAEALEVSQKAASIRYVRALGRLRKILERAPGFESSAGGEALE